jgi:sensor histidine kinase regulating citrate/malate metabolism
LLEITFKDKELATLEQMLVLQKKQLRSSKHTFELFNVKFHDMKHQLSQLEGRISSEEIGELNEIISMFDINLRTGNEALDIILFEKAYACAKYNIKINCIADGNILSFMRSSDIYSLFGNALDNSIEAVQNIDSDNKTISIHIKKNMNMVSIHLENQYQGNINMFDDLPQTTKADKNYHGFGMKSIKMIVEKYGGILSIDTKNNLFQLNILIPTAD